MICFHQFQWVKTSIRGLAVCSVCGVVDTEVEEKDCVNYIDPIKAALKTKEKKKADFEIRKAATIAYLKSKGLPTKE